MICLTYGMHIPTKNLAPSGQMQKTRRDIPLEGLRSEREKHLKTLPIQTFFFFAFFFVPQLELQGSQRWWDFCVCDHLASMQVVPFPCPVMLLV